MPETYGYVRTSRPRVSELAGSDPETQRQQLLAAGVALSHIYQDVGVSGTSGTNSRRGWHSLDSRLAQGDTLVVVSIDRRRLLSRTAGIRWTTKPEGGGFPTFQNAVCRCVFSRRPWICSKMYLGTCCSASTTFAGSVNYSCRFTLGWWAYLSHTTPSPSPSLADGTIAFG